MLTCLIVRRSSLKLCWNPWFRGFQNWRWWWSISLLQTLLTLFSLTKMVYYIYYTFTIFNGSVGACIWLSKYFAGFLAATVTPQHLLLNRNSLFQGGLQPHNYCLPVLKRETHSKFQLHFLQILYIFLTLCLLVCQFQQSTEIMSRKIIAVNIIRYSSYSNEKK